MRNSIPHDNEAAATAEPASAVAPGRALGLYPAPAFRIVDGRCRDCATIPQALRYFEHETIAVPRPGYAIAGYARGTRAADDVRAWGEAFGINAPLACPPLVWIAAPEVVERARLAADASSLTLAGGATLPLRLVPKIASNSAFFDASSALFLGARTLKLRGTLTGDALVARTLWPEDFRLDAAMRQLPLDPALPAGVALRGLVRALPQGGATSPFAAHWLWRRDAGAPLVPGRAVVAIVLNGAQGDDDEAHGGHFALITGRTREDGAIGDWLVNNFYSLDIESEKGIIAAALPLDNYLADLNSGQNWYRPSYIVAAVLAEDRAAVMLQGALNRVYNQFYRHQLVYRHATMNCAGVSVDVLRALGVPVQARGATNRWLAAVAVPYLVATERPLDRAKNAYEYLVEDQTRMLPAAAFEEIGASLLALARGGPAGASGGGALARMLAADIDAIAYLHLPQWPSSRVFGDAPVVTIAEYRSRLPADRNDAKVIPVPPRPFPDELRDPDLLPPERRAADRALAAWSLGAIAMLALVAWLVSGWM